MYPSLTVARKSSADMAVIVFTVRYAAEDTAAHTMSAPAAA